ncbi:MAG: GNAT family N-acetyltransferase [Bacteroidales bacterium]|nr:GNAT family N-acetyltransferase [Bacteroidales bacterium]MCF8402704.1 GNAT family N-acetyltransferase [Bacteroidales bacterium]
MKIINLTEEYKHTYFHCLEHHSEEMTEAVAMKEAWYNKMKDNGLRVKLALSDEGVVAGLIQYFPIEHSWVKGKDLYFIGCIWVHSNLQGYGNFQKRGMGTALLKAAEEDVAEIGAKGIVAWGTSLPVWMKASWYKKRGYLTVERKGFLGDLLLWKKLAGDAEPPGWNKQAKMPQKSKDKVHVSCLTSGWCTAMNLSCLRTRNVAWEFGDRVELEEVDTSDKTIFNEWGTTDSIFIDGKKIVAGPPPPEEKIRKRIAKSLVKKR